MEEIDVNKLKVGVTYQDDDGDPYRVLKYDFSKMGRGKANIKVKVRNLFTGAVVVKSYLSGSRVKKIDLNKKELQYLYADEDKVFFMDPETFEQIEMEKKILGDDIKYLVEGGNAWVLFWEDKILGVELPASVVLEVTECEPGEKGNSATNVLKPATLNNGLIVMVPLFIKMGDKVKVSTDSGSYMARANN